MNFDITQGNGHRLAALTLLLMVLAAVYWLVDQIWVAKYEFYQTEIEKLQDRLQRLQAMSATRESLEAQIERVREDSSVDAYYLQQTSPTLAASQLQQQVKAVVEGNGGSLVSTQILPVTQEDGFPRVAIRVQMTGGTEILWKVLHTLESNRPLLFIDDLRVTARTIRRRNPRDRSSIETELQLTTQFELAGYLRRGQG